MMDPAQTGDGRRRGKKNRSKNVRRKRGTQKPHNSPRGPKKESYAPQFTPDDSSILGRRVPVVKERDGVQKEELNEFSLFCAYCLGITAEDQYREPRLEEVARRFGKSPTEIRDALKEYGLDDQTLRDSDFDLKGYRLDIKLAPEGISRTESAREMFAELQSMRS